MAENVKCKNCNRLKNHWCEAVIDSPDEDMIRDCQHFSQKTNADRIRAMTDEELMKFIEDTGIAGCPYPAMSCRASCQVCILDWLKQPAEVSHD